MNTTRRVVPNRAKVEDVWDIYTKRAKSYHIVAPFAFQAGLEGLDFLQTLVNLECIMPRHPMLSNAIGKWLSNVLHGEECTIFTIVCPDYSWEKDLVTGMYVYTFKELWDGIGITAQRALDQLPKLWTFLKDAAALHGVAPPRVKFVVAIADNESDSAALVEQVGLDVPEFHARCRRSIQKLEAELLATDPTIPVTGYMLTEIDPQRWIDAKKRAQHVMDSGHHFARLVVPHEPEWQRDQWSRILRARQNLYSRMYPGRDPNDVLQEQGVDYVASGFFSDGFPHCLYFGVDNHVMDLFAQGGAGNDYRAVVYMRANYK